MAVEERARAPASELDPLAYGRALLTQKGGWTLAELGRQPSERRAGALDATELLKAIQRVADARGSLRAHPE